LVDGYIFCKRVTWYTFSVLHADILLFVVVVVVFVSSIIIIIYDALSRLESPQ